MSFELLLHPLQEVDARLSDLFAGAPLGVALAIAFLLGARFRSRSPGRGHLAGSRRARRHPGRRAPRRLVGIGVTRSMVLSISILAVTCGIVLAELGAPRGDGSGGAGRP